MSKKKAKKEFDCIAFKRRVQGKIYEETKGLSLEERVAYFRDKSEFRSAGKMVETVAKRGAFPKT